MPDLRISEEVANCVASTLSVEINKILAAAHEIALGKDFKQFIKVVLQTLYEEIFFTNRLCFLFMKRESS